MSGRKINITTDLKELAESEFLHTFYISPAGNVCFHGKCSYYCDTSHGICGNPDDLEASLAAFLPPKSIAPRKKWRNPWRQSYNKHKKAKWEISPNNYCDELVKKVIPYHKGRRLLDIMDMAIFDFLMGNLDRYAFKNPLYNTFTNIPISVFKMSLLLIFSCSTGLRVLIQCRKFE